MKTGFFSCLLDKVSGEEYTKSDHVVTKGVMRLEQETGTRKKILDAALQEFGSKGYSHASTNRIHEAAGVSKGVVFKHFQSKAGLYAAVFRKAFDKMLLAMESQPFYADPDPFERVMRVTMWKILYTKDHPLDTQVMTEGIMNPPKELQGYLGEHLDSLMKTSVRHFFEDIPMDQVNPIYSKEEVIRFLEYGILGLQQTVVNQKMSMDQLAAFRDESIRFLQIILKGMEIKHGERI